MLRSRSRCACVVASAGAAASLLVVSSALADVSGTVIQTRRDLDTGVESAVPGLPAATLAAIANANAANNTNGRVVWNEPSNANPGFSPNNGTPVIDAAGNIYFIGTAAQYTFTDPDTLSTVFVMGGTSNFGPTGQSNNRGLFCASAASGWANSAITMVARDGSTSSNVTGPALNSPLLGGTSVPITGLPTGSVLNGSSNGPGLGAGVSISPNGKLLFNSVIAPYIDSTAGTGPNTGASFLTGPNTGFASSGMHADSLSGTAGATLNMTASQVVNSMSINNAGQFVFASTTAGGDTVTSGAQQNNSGIWQFSSSGNTKIMRRGDAAPGAADGGAGTNAAFGAAPINNNLRINSGGDVLFPETLATTTVPAGFTGANSNQSGVLYYKPSSGSMQLVAQAGTPVPGLSGVNYL
ncbi:MAG TPA: choice-of-anchor tandem repeat NxxGxxAF-containing protein, partial [Phycisphaerales bacterium]|nr:choice-of-anchor tandem repeat NxxGxxAF-containing protein [Phycisphaerales bacterium]